MGVLVSVARRRCPETTDPDRPRGRGRTRAAGFVRQILQNLVAFRQVILAIRQLIGIGL